MTARSVLALAALIPPSDILTERSITAYADIPGQRTVMTERCSWCRTAIITSITSQAAAASDDLWSHVVNTLLVGRDEHLSVARCADAGHDPGDEDDDQPRMRLAWHPAGGGGD